MSRAFVKSIGLITRIPRTRRYTVTPQGLRIAMLLRRVYARILRPGLALTTGPAGGPHTIPLRRAFERLDHVIERWCLYVGKAA
jgi:hypothetical protein